MTTDEELIDMLEWLQKITELNNEGCKILALMRL